MSEQQEFCEIALENGTYEARPTKKFLLRKPFEKRNPGVIKALIPGVVAEIGAEPGKAVREGDTLMILEAMKMLNRIKAPIGGQVKAIAVAPGEKVAKGHILIEIG